MVRHAQRAYNTYILQLGAVGRRYEEVVKFPCRGVKVLYRCSRVGALLEDYVEYGDLVGGGVDYVVVHQDVATLCFRVGVL